MTKSGLVKRMPWTLLVVAAMTLAPARTSLATTTADGATAAEVERLTSDILSLDGDPAYGEYLGGECVTCHQRSGASDGIPPITGLPVDYAVRALVEYKLGIRGNEVMKLMTARLDEEEIAALAAYFAGLEP